VAAILDRDEAETPAGVGFPPTRVEGFDDLIALTLEPRLTRTPQTLVAITAGLRVICRGYNRTYGCGATLSDRLPRTVIWGAE